MSTLNLSTNGPSIAKSYQSVVNAPKPSGPATSSPTYGQWALFSVSAPLVNAFQKDSGGKESVLKVQSTGEGELTDLIDDFSDGRIQFAFVRVKDPNSGLPKNALIAWCGEGVPERTKGYFTSHLAAVEKVLHGYHVQITARSDRDLTPDSIVRKISESSGSNYSGRPQADPDARQPPPPPPASKPVFSPTRSGGGASGGFNPLAGRGSTAQQPGNVDQDGWGDDAPPVTRSQLERVQSAYQPTKVNMKELASQKEPSRFNGRQDDAQLERPDVVKGGYQPVGKVDIAALRRQAQESKSAGDDRPTAVKGSYEPVGKVDIAAIRARAQPPPSDAAAPSKASAPREQGMSADSKPSGVSPTPFGQSERLTSLPKPKVGGVSGSAAFRGTKPPAPSGFGFGAKPAPVAAPVGAASRTFADQGGKTPAQLWAERKARERGLSGASEQPPGGQAGATSPVASQKSGGEWKSGYSGKSWANVSTTKTGRSADSGDADQKDTREEATSDLPLSGGISQLRDRFTKGPEATPPPLDTSNKPNAVARGEAAPSHSGLPSRPRAAEDVDRDDERHEEEETAQPLPTPPAVPRSPTPPTPPAVRSSSPIRIAMPVGRSKETELEPPEERFAPPPIPAESTARMAPRDEDEDDQADEPITSHDPARGAAEAAAEATFGDEAVNRSAYPESQGVSGKSALIMFDYDKAEDNEIELKEGEYVTNIEMVDDDWWMGQNSQGETGLFPSNYVELVDDEPAQAHADVGESNEHAAPAAPTPAERAAADTNRDDEEEELSSRKGPTATALYDYEAAEANELTFTEGAKITGIEFPDDDWWFGHCGNEKGLFPANYVELDQ